MTEDEFAALYHATAGPLWRYLSRVSRRRDVADDLLQEAYVRFLTSQRTDLSATEAKLYLFRIASNLLHDRWRRRDDFKGDGELEHDPVVTTVDNTLDAQRVLARLKPRSRELLCLAYLEGMSHREIAKITGLNALSVRVLLSRARIEALHLMEPKEDTR